MTYVLIVLSLLIVTVMAVGVLWQLGTLLADRHRR